MVNPWLRKIKPGRRKVNGSRCTGHKHLIELRHVAKTYGSAAGSFIALQDINMQVDAGQFIAVVGKSGSGKTTLTNMITGIDRPTAGEIVVGGVPAQSMARLWRD